MKIEQFEKQFRSVMQFVDSDIDSSHVNQDNWDVRGHSDSFLLSINM